MALNFSQRPDNLVSPERIENCFDFGGERVERDGSPDSSSNDVVDLLPSDPFGMDIRWLENFEVDYGGRNVGGSDEYSLFAGLSYIWNNALRFQSIPGTLSSDGMFSNASPNVDARELAQLGFFESAINANGFMGTMFDDLFSNTRVVDLEAGRRELAQLGFFESFSNHTFSDACVVDPYSDAMELAQLGIFETLNNEKDIAGSSQHIEEAPHDAFLYALSYLGVRDLLSVERVCKYLRSTVQSDPLLWQSIHIGQPLNTKIKDDDLLQLTSRAQGNLHCLSLAQCVDITDYGLKRVLDTNPKLTKLFVPNCTKLTIEGLVNSLKAFQSNKASPGIKHLRITGLSGVTLQQFEELNSLLGTDIHSTHQNGKKPHFFLEGNSNLHCCDERVIDIDICPRCERLGLVYDCPSEGCQANDHTSQVCRACTLCISRCVHCGKCINDRAYEETFALDFLCRDCSNNNKHGSKEKQDENQDIRSKSRHHG